jgi:NTE family protein
MASAAIPLLYPAENIGGERYGDGAVRQLLPLSPAVRLGADRIFILGVGAAKEKVTYEYAATHSPTISQIGGHLLDSVFMDNVDADLERMQAMNDAIRQIPKGFRGKEQSGLKLLDSFVFSPPTALHRLVSQHAHKLPVAVRIALRSIGAIGKDRNDVLSYLLTDGAYCKALIRRGFMDGMSRRDVITRWIGQEQQVVKTGTSTRQSASRWSVRDALPWLRRAAVN